MKKYQLLSNTKWCQNIAVYILQDKDKNIVGKIHVAYSKHTYRGERMRIDVYEHNSLSYQYAGDAEEFPFANAFNKIEIQNIKLFARDTPVTHDEPGHAQYETRNYAAGLTRLKLFGISVNCVL